MFTVASDTCKCMKILKGYIMSVKRKSKNHSQYYCQGMGKRKTMMQCTTQKTKDRATRYPLITKKKLKRVGSSCSICDTRHVTLVTDPLQKYGHMIKKIHAKV